MPMPFGGPRGKNRKLAGITKTVSVKQPGQVALGQQMGPLAASAQAQILPPWLYQTPGAREYYKSSALLGFNLPANSTVQVTFTDGSNTLQIGAGQKAVLRFVSIFIQNPTTAASVFFTLKANNGPVAGWDAVPFYPVNASAEIREFSDTIRFPQQTNITAFFTNQSALAWTVGMQMSGWIWDINEAAKLTGSLDY